MSNHDTLPPELIMPRVAEKMRDSFPPKLAAMGVTAEVEVVYQVGAYYKSYHSLKITLRTTAHITRRVVSQVGAFIVLSLHITHVAADVLAEARGKGKLASALAQTPRLPAVRGGAAARRAPSVPVAVAGRALSGVSVRVPSSLGLGEMREGGGRLARDYFCAVAVAAGMAVVGQRPEGSWCLRAARRTHTDKSMPGVNAAGAATTAIRPVR